MSPQFDFAIRSSSFTDGVIKLPDGKVLLDMRGDKRIDDIESITRSTMQKNGWKLPDNEREVSLKVAETMHEKRFYGPYSSKSSEIQVNLGALQEEITSLELNKDNESFLKRMGLSEKQVESKLEFLKDQEIDIKEQLGKDLGGRNRLLLKDIKSGETACLHQAGITSLIMHRLSNPDGGNKGGEYDMCIGVAGGSVSISHHAYVQSRQGDKNIIDPTNPDTYFYNLNSAEIRDHEIVRTSTGPIGGVGHSSFNYGGGKYPNALQSRFPDKYLREELEENQPKNHGQMVQTILEANTRKAEDEKLTFVLPKDVSKEVRDIMKSLDKGMFGRGTVSGEELEEGAKNLKEEQIELLEKAGVSFFGDTSYKLEEASCNTQNHKRDLGPPNR